MKTTLRTAYYDDDAIIEKLIVLNWDNGRSIEVNIQQGTPDQVSNALMILARQIQDDKMAGKLDE